MSPRKRKRSQAFAEHEDGDEFFPQTQGRQEVDGGERHQKDKERNVWDAFREEHFEGTVN